MKGKIKRIAPKVKELLKEKPHLRDSDNKLIASIWWIELGGQVVSDLSGMDVLNRLSEGQLTSPESIRRSRQKIQEENPHLRGESYKVRKLVEEPKVKDEIRNWTEAGQGDLF